MLTTFSLNFCWLANAVFLNAQFEQQGESVFPNKWTFIFYVSMGETFEKRHKNLNASLSAGRTWTWWNIWVISPIIANCLSRIFNKTPTRLLRKSGPLSKCSFNDFPFHLCASVKNASNFVRLVYTGDCAVRNVVGYSTGRLTVCLIQLCCMTFRNIVFHCLFVPFR